ncbi:aminotransferase class III-fold pyridoxal phosphate-dependent enzyme [Blastopirellula marina]|uniref:Acetylornithine aminotransferase n=1 Tax=Blastopirellula marina TaxID=124 RepID=A0A2S8GAQ7_9BACT|nr:aminotransferase class III-fold pyridoxal phosphate-dependent enzyme [Blastopirellula marina]PQO41184.1 acetylornithine aminotransferase [Blastopirellula marina]PTL46060.1 acetylornithine aminotransferase [Blastopirellula marina]
MDASQLIAQQLLADPRVAEATRLLQAAVTEHAAQLTARPADPQLAEELQNHLNEYANLRGNPLFFPYLGSGAGRSSLVELADGSVKYDLITGIGVHAMGHANPELIAELVPAVISDTVMQGNLQQNAESYKLSRELVALAKHNGAKLDHCFLSSSGAMANENALKILFQYRPGSQRILAFENAFAGRSMVLNQVTDRPKNRVGQPQTIAVDYVPFYDAHADAGVDSLHHSLRVLERHLQRFPDAHCGFIMELVQGEGGYYGAPREYFIALCSLLRKYNVPIMFDEIQTFGRTLQPFAFQMLRLDDYADVVTVGKMTQVCATLFGEKLNPKPGLLSQTFTSSTTAIVAARWILRQLTTGEFYGEQGRIAAIHQRFASRFEALREKAPEKISGPWGVGAMVALTPFDGSAEAAKRVLHGLYDAGVIAFVAGQNPARVRFLPPFLSITDEEIDAACDIIDDVILALPRED